MTNTGVAKYPITIVALIQQGIQDVFEKVINAILEKREVK